MARPLCAVGAMALVLFGLMQLMANQFGFDRDGFRVFVLSAPRGGTSCWARTWPLFRWRWAWRRSC